MKVCYSSFALQFELMRRSIADCLQLGCDLPEVCFMDGIYSACDLLPNGTTLRIAVRADDRKAHLCVMDPNWGRVCLTGNALYEVKGAVTHVKAGPGQQRTWVTARLRDQHPTWCHVEAAA